MPSFDLNTYAVTPGTHSLEASAGTGKTFSLVGLILRQVVENDLRLPRVLAVTFTKKATGELAERLRQKLAEAATLLADKGAPVSADPQLAHWQRQVSGDEALRLRYLTRIRTALAESDNASVFTIHGFCQRVLSECAFESGLAFDLDMEDAGAAFTRTAVRDFVRELYRPIALATPFADAARFIHDDLDIDESWLTELARHLAAGGKVEWTAITPTYGARVAGGAALTAFFDARNRALAAFVANKTTEMDELLDAIGRLSALIPDEAADSNRKQAVASLKDFAALVFAARLDAKLDAVKSAAGVLTFDDLIRKTAEALAQPAVGEALAARLRERYAIGLIDEFQDTDALQIKIFQKIFAGLPLLFIGDPKQSIYRFRGADVSAYANAVASVPQENRCLLDTNFRSTAPMIHAANALFAADKSLSKGGLFMDGETDTFIPVNPSAKRIPPVTDASGAALTALTLVWAEGSSAQTPLSTRRAESRFANDLAARIRELLNGHRLGEQALLASDIAVLVRSGKQGALVQAALRAAGVPASRVSGSVFADDAAGALRRVLAAFLAPRRPAVLRAALAGPIVGLDAEAIRNLDTHEEDYRDWADAFANAAELWKRSGVAAALTGFLNAKALPEKMLARADGERLMADLRQLIEFAHAEELAGHHAPESLLGWLDAQIHASGEALASDANRQRLESDGDCVTIMTMHAAKGLEFPVVFVPFAWKFSQDNRKAFVSGALGDRRGVAVNGNHAELKNIEDAEQHSEQARLLYVAVTRAKSACFLYTGLIADARLTNSIGDTPLGLLGPLSGKGILKPAGKTTKEKILPCSTRADWETFAQGKLLNEKAPGCARVVDCAKRAVAPATPAAAPAAKSAPLASIAPRELRGAIDRQRISASYSGIAVTLGHAELAPRAEAEETSHRHDERRVAASPDFAQPSGGSDSIHTFPRGATVGDAVHEFLEEHAFSAPAEATAVSRALRCNGLDAERWTPVLRERIDAWMATPLTDHAGQVFALRDIGAADRLPEMGFDLRARLSSGAAVAGALSASTSAAMLAPTIAALRKARPVNLDGYLTGFLDLIFRRDGRYYILDWKTNHLGPSLDDYGQPSLERAMAEHHYHLQYHFYLVALDAHLRASLPDYAPETHLGGVYYLFVRGLDPDRPDNGVFRAAAEPRVIRALTEALGNTAAIHRTTEI